mmetsp:Transcript_5657/g.21418  ORF Transcript_5657/g.21418 Transcript_5657/m.21418 type:complete len:91 (+) Transcript_5657:1914-2186(+)
MGVTTSTPRSAAAAGTSEAVGELPCSGRGSMEVEVEEALEREAREAAERRDSIEVLVECSRALKAMGNTSDTSSGSHSPSASIFAYLLVE